MLIKKLPHLNSVSYAYIVSPYPS